ncbi:MAG: DUF1697 domain-containing protein [Lentimicrobiaceae bacterium]|jgi:uncharacterized protein (DUF1697 family)|nr:DUF1697 domain-containing protein [Lentimicrobiaceae bacterium]
MKGKNYLALLRGINVGGKNTLKMDELKAIFEEMNFRNLQTYIQSGNIFLTDSETDKIKIAKRIENELFQKMGLKIFVLVLEISELENIINNLPNGFGYEYKKYKYDIIFLGKPLTTKDVMKVITIKESENKIYEGENVFYVKRLSEKLTGSYIAEISTKWEDVVVRNLNTSKKLYEIMLERKEK